MQRDGLAREPDVQRRRVVLGKDGDGAEAGIGRGAQDANRDLAAIRNQQLANGYRVSRLARLPV